MQRGDVDQITRTGKARGRGDRDPLEPGAKAVEAYLFKAGPRRLARAGLGPDRPVDVRVEFPAMALARNCPAGMVDGLNGEFPQIGHLRTVHRRRGRWLA
jgi:hypothetical protein